MNESLFEKDNVLTALTEINNQLEELESKIGESFSGLRSQWYREEIQRLSACEKKISSIEKLTEKIIGNRDNYHFPVGNKPVSSLVIKLGFQ
jgi:hypothetical protein